MKSNAVHGGDSQTARHHLSQLGQPIAQAVVNAKDFLAGLEKSPTFRCHREIFVCSLDQRYFELLLNRADLLTHGTLVDRVHFGGLGEAGSLDEIAENLERFDLHSLAISRSSRISFPNI